MDMNVAQLIKYTVELLSGEEAEVSIHADETGAVIDVRVRGKVANVLGRDGNTIKAIRTIAKAIGYQDSHRVKIRVNEHANHRTTKPPARA